MPYHLRNTNGQTVAGMMGNSILQLRQLMMLQVKGS